ncbi:MAG: SPOR domain-containing protein [Vicingaceae bacterium]
MRLFTLFTLVFAFLGHITAQNSDFALRFNQAKDLLYNFKPDEALPVLLQLEKEDPTNANILYLIGACYTDYNPDGPKSIEYLIKAEKGVSDHYDAESASERNASIHLYYFLAVAFAQNHRCDEAAASNQKFRQLIGRIGGAYIRDAEFWVNACYTLQKNVVVDEVNSSPEPPIRDPYAIVNAKIVTQSQEYSTPSPLWGVQVGSFSKFVPIGDFDDIKNVDAFIDREGKVRYVVGSFAFRHQCETLLRVLQESGYKDAFIVDVNKERQFHDRIITVNNVSIKPSIRGKIHYRLQIGAFRDSIPMEMAQKYVKIDGIIENEEEDLTLLSVGHFDTYEEASTYKAELEKIAITDAFVVAYNYDRKISVKQAKAYQEKQKSEDQ